MLLVKAPVALTGPSVVLLSAVVGLSAVPQTTPCWVGLGTPRPVMLPLPVAVVVVIAVTCLGGDRRQLRVVKVTSSP